MISYMLGNSFNSKNVFYCENSLKKDPYLQNLTDVFVFPYVPLINSR